MPGNLTLTLREDWNSETISKLGFDSPSYRLEQLDPMDKRKYTICFEDDRARFVTIPVSNIISITETGDITAVNAVTEIKFKTSKRADVKNKTITTDTRMGIVRIADSVHGDYDITISYSQFQQFCAMIEAYRKQNSKNEKTMEDTKSLTETLKEMKELLDLGIITEEEFAKKKEELLSRI